MSVAGAPANGENEKIQAQVGVSIGLARSVVASWLPPLTDNEKLEAKEASRKPKSSAVLVNRRAPRAGLGSTGEMDDKAELSIEEMKIKRKLMQKERKLQQERAERASQGSSSKKKRSVGGAADQLNDSSDDENVRKKGTKQTKNLSSKQGVYDTFVSKGKPSSKKVVGFGR